MLCTLHIEGATHLACKATLQPHITGADKHSCTAAFRVSSPVEPHTILENECDAVEPHHEHDDDEQ